MCRWIYGSSMQVVEVCVTVETSQKSFESTLQSAKSGSLLIFAPNEKVSEFTSGFLTLQRIAEKVLTQVIFILSGYIFFIIS